MAKVITLAVVRIFYRLSKLTMTSTGLHNPKSNDNKPLPSTVRLKMWSFNSRVVFQFDLSTRKEIYFISIGMVKVRKQK